MTKIIERTLVFNTEIEMAQFVFKYKDLMVPYSKEQIQDKYYYGKGDNKFDNWMNLGIKPEAILEDGRTFISVLMNGVNFKKVKNLFERKKIYFGNGQKELKIEERFIFKGEI